MRYRCHTSITPCVLGGINPGGTCMAGLTRWRPGATRTGGVMGLTTEHDGPGRPAGPDRRGGGVGEGPRGGAGRAGEPHGGGEGGRAAGPAPAGGRGGGWRWTALR